jgi:hypothetical protein
MYGKSNYRKEYFFIATPQLYILDKDKRIRLKNIDAEGLPGILDALYKEMRETESKKKN